MLFLAVLTATFLCQAGLAASIPNGIVINGDSNVQYTRLPATNNLDTEERITLLYPTQNALRAALTHPIALDDDTTEKLMVKLSDIVGEPVYPSQIAKLVFESAFTDPEDVRLTPQQRTENVGYVLSNLGCGYPEVIEKIFAFYYAYSFENFALQK